MTTRHAQALLFLENLAADPPQLPFEPSLLPVLSKHTSRDFHVPPETVTSLVSCSQGLAVQVLRLANSAYYGLETKVSSLARAIAILGMNEVRNLVLAYGAAAALRKMPLPPDFSVHALWEHQLRTAIMAYAMGDMARAAGLDMRLTGPDELYAAGLLHDLGKVILASRRPNDWTAIQDLTRENNLELFAAEEQYWGIDHCTVGARVLAFWDLPPQLTELVSWHHAPQLAEEPYTTGTALLAAANRLANAVSRKKELTAEPLAQADILPEVWDILPPAMRTDTTLARLRALSANDAVADKVKALAGY